MSSIEAQNNRIPYSRESINHTNKNIPTNWPIRVDVKQYHFSEKKSKNNKIKRPYGGSKPDNLGVKQPQSAMPQLLDQPESVPSNASFDQQEILQAYLLLVQGSSNDLLQSSPSNQNESKDKNKTVDRTVLAGATLGFGLLLFGFQTGNIIFTLIGCLVIITAIAHHGE